MNTKSLLMTIKQLNSETNNLREATDSKQAETQNSPKNTIALKLWLFLLLTGFYWTAVPLLSSNLHHQITEKKTCLQPRLDFKIMSLKD